MEAVAGGPLSGLAATVVGWFVAIGGGAVMVVMGWQFLKVMLSGGNERALMGVGKTLLVIGIAYAALTNLPAAAGLVFALGRTIVAALIQGVQSSLTGGPV